MNLRHELTIPALFLRTRSEVSKHTGPGVSGTVGFEQGRDFPTLCPNPLLPKEGTGGRLWSGFLAWHGRILKEPPRELAGVGSVNSAQNSDHGELLVIQRFK